MANEITLTVEEDEQVDLSIGDESSVDLTVDDADEVDLSLSEQINIINPDVAFSGPYEYTPTQSSQYISIEGLVATSNITINPIPSNYGLITWNGSVLTVS